MCETSVIKISQTKSLNTLCIFHRTTCEHDWKPTIRVQQIPRKLRLLIRWFKNNIDFHLQAPSTTKKSQLDTKGREPKIRAGRALHGTERNFGTLSTPDRKLKRRPKVLAATWILDSRSAEWEAETRSRKNWHRDHQQLTWNNRKWSTLAARTGPCTTGTGGGGNQSETKPWVHGGAYAVMESKPGRGPLCSRGNQKFNAEPRTLRRRKIRERKRAERARLGKITAQEIPRRCSQNPKQQEINVRLYTTWLPWKVSFSTEARLKKLDLDPGNHCPESRSRKWFLGTGNWIFMFFERRFFSLQSKQEFNSETQSSSHSLPHFFIGMKI
jgi:hypothetical protein